jgi:hypothetical protein
MININDIVSYENGEMEEEEMIEFFQSLINSGMAWTLQGSYGRMAMRLVEDGFCTLPEQSEENNV